MRNKDLVQKEKQEIMQRMSAAVKEENEDAFVQAWTDLADSIQKQVLEEADGYVQGLDRQILAGRGARQLTSEENRYYEAVIGAMRSSNPRQALGELDAVLPKTTIDAVFDDLVDQHPLLDAINFQNTSGLIEMIVNTGTKQLATWSTLTAEIVKELTGGESFKSNVELALNNARVAAQI